MKTIKYEIKELKRNIFTIIVPDQYDLAMLFCKYQEYYESPNENFRGKYFSIWDYIEWYSKDHNDSFTYAADWGGFNIPFEIMKECYEYNSIPENIYDVYMNRIISRIEEIKVENTKSYVIGVNELDCETHEHETCHGLYYINEEYKQIADEITTKLDISLHDNLKQILLNVGYTDHVINDEIQAFMTTGGHPIFNDIENIKELQEIYQNQLKRFIS
jgi:hypothetical protein